MSSHQTNVDRLDLLQSQQNNGRGISCVRQLVSELRRDRKTSAQAIANNEWDKISTYPEVAKVVISMGLMPENSYIHKQ